MAKEIANQLVQIQPKPAAKSQLTLDEVRARLSASKGKEYWQSLEQITSSDGFDEMMQREFPRHASEWLDPVSRRGFLKLMGASMALAGLSACTKQPVESIVPYVRQPEDLIPGRPKFYATAMPFPFGAQPVLVKSEEYRPIKIEGNPDHPESNGATDAYTQCSILDLYDPDRSQTSSYKGEPRVWGDFANWVDAYRVKHRGGAPGLRFLTPTCVSPTFAWLMESVLKLNAGAKWYQWDPVNRDNVRAASKQMFGQYADPVYKLEGANVIISLDADFISGLNFPGFVRLAREYARRRKLEPHGEMSRLYVVESFTTTTGAKADHRLRMRASDVAGFAAALAGAVGAGGSGASSLAGEEQKFLQTLVQDLNANRGACVVIPGEHQPPAVHMLAAQMNQALGNVGKTVFYNEPIEPVPTEQAAGLKELVADMKAGKVDLLVMMDVNPVYNAPADLDFLSALQNVPEAVHLGNYRDETARYSSWHLHAAHYLEMWGDARAADGTVSIIQPLIEPLYSGASSYQVAAVFAAQAGLTPYAAVRQYWTQNGKAGADFETMWRKALHDGFIPNTAAAPKTLPPKGGSTSAPHKLDESAIEVVLRPDPTIFDGRYSNNGWLQECPKWMTRLCWDNAAHMSFKTASDLKVKEEDVIEIKVANGRSVRATVLPVPGMPDNSITLTLGYGRKDAGRVGNDMGYNAYEVRTADAPSITSAAKSDIKKTGETYKLAIVQVHELIEGTDKSLPAAEALRRSIIRSATFDEYQKEPNFAHSERYLGDPRMADTLYTFYDDKGYEHSGYNYSEGYQWSMTVDMNSCVGCNACVVACVAENNIPVVGKDQTKVGRQMYWLRVDTYYTGDLANPNAVFQPMFCQHCENAPCEPVCPVGATVHTPEGLNMMVYNRCVGTRYCSNNCPYKVRRFNFLLFSDYETESLKLLRNPDVTVRSRGVMEKCTYCVQRINAAKINAEIEEVRMQQEDPSAKRPVRDGEIVTACQQACPTDALVFGNLNDPNSRVSKQKQLERNYGVLTPVNTRPRTSYLAEVTNPHPGLEGKRVIEEALATGAGTTNGN